LLDTSDVSGNLSLAPKSQLQWYQAVFQKSAVASNVSAAIG